MSLATMEVTPEAGMRERKPDRRRSLDDAHDVFFAHHQILSAFDLDRLARVFAEKNLVAFLDLERTNFAIVLDLAVAYGDHFAGLWLIGRGVRDHDARGGLVRFFQTRNDDPVMQGSNVH